MGWRNLRLWLFLLTFILLVTGCIERAKVISKEKNPLPIKPETAEWLFENSEVISYVEVLKVDKKIEREDKPLPPGIYPTFSKQHAEVNLLEILKGPEDLRGTIITIIKDRSRYYLTEKQRLVVYLKEDKGRYHTIDAFGGEHRLASTLANVNSLKKDMGSGIVVGILNKGNFSDLKLHILQGRHKAPLIPGDEVEKVYLLKVEEVDRFDISKIPLEPGSYTILLELEGDLHSHYQLINGYYPYLILKEDNWRVLYFNLKKIK